MLLQAEPYCAYIKPQLLGQREYMFIQFEFHYLPFPLSSWSDNADISIIWEEKEIKSVNKLLKYTTHFAKSSLERKTGKRMRTHGKLNTTWLLGLQVPYLEISADRTSVTLKCASPPYFQV